MSRGYFDLRVLSFFFVSSSSSCFAFSRKDSHPASPRFADFSSHSAMIPASESRGITAALGFCSHLATISSTSTLIPPARYAYAIGSLGFAIRSICRRRSCKTLEFGSVDSDKRTAKSDLFREVAKSDSTELSFGPAHLVRFQSVTLSVIRTRSLTVAAFFASALRLSLNLCERRATTSDPSPTASVPNPTTDGTTRSISKSYTVGEVMTEMLAVQP